MRLFLTLTLCLLTITSGQVFAASSLTPDQKAEVETIIRQLLTDKEPELVMKAAKKLQEREEAKNSSESGKAVLANKEKLENNATDPIAGNPKGDVAIIEFFDYQCGYCKVTLEPLKKIISADKNVKIIYKEYPILGEGSTIASKAALASRKQKRYDAMHTALLSAQQRFTEESVLDIAKKVGLNIEQLKKDMMDPAIETILEENRALGMEVGARGTPSFVIGDKVYPGSLSYEQLKSKVDAVRKSKN